MKENQNDKFFDVDYRLSKNFSLKEFKVSKTFPEIADQMQFDYVDVLTIKILTTEILQTIRDKWGPLTILSGKRSEELNKKVGGSKVSDHLTANAADFTPFNFEPVEIFRWIVEKSGLPYREVIFYPNERFIHISINIPIKEVQHEALINIGTEYFPYHSYYKEIKE